MRPVTVRPAYSRVDDSPQDGRHERSHALRPRSLAPRSAPSAGAAAAGRHRRRRHVPGAGLRQVGRGLPEGHRRRASTTSRSAPAAASSRSSAKTVDFGASDAPLKAEELAKDGLIQFPTVIGGVVPVVNIEGVAPGQLQADRPGARRHLPRQDHQVERPGASTALNPGVKLPDAAIAVGAPRRRLGHHASSSPTTCRR